MVQYETIDAFPHETLTEGIPHETVDHLPLRSSALSVLSSCSSSYGTRVHSLPAEVNRVSSLEPRELEKEVTLEYYVRMIELGELLEREAILLEFFRVRPGLE